MLPSMFFYGQYDLYKRWLSCQRITVVPLVAMFVATFLHIPLCYLFVIHFDLDIRGLGIASSLKDLVLLLSVMIYSNCNEQVRPALSMPDSTSLSGWGEYLKISLPGTVMMCAEWWAFEILVVLSGTLGVPEQASQVLVASLNSILFMAPLGVQEATTALVGNCIGANNVPLAKRFFSLIYKINTLMCITLSTITFFARWQIVAFFTAEE